MSNYNNLKSTIDASIKQNNNQEITGSVLNSVLNQMVTTLGAGYQYVGVATTTTNPGSPDAKVFYIANGKGTYTNFGDVEVTEDDVVVLYWDSSWHKVSTGIASQQKLSELEEVVVGSSTLYNFDFSDDTRRAITNQGEIYSTTAYRRSALIPINKGDKIKFSIQLNAYCALIAFTTDDINFVVKVQNDNISSPQDVEWVSDSDGYVVVSANIYQSPISYTIVKGGIVNDISLLKQDVTEIEEKIDALALGASSGTTEYRPSLGNSFVGRPYFDTTLGKMIYWNGSRWVDADGFISDSLRVGTTEQRPTSANIASGFQYFDTTLGKPIFYNGTKWVDATGADA